MSMHEAPSVPSLRVPIKRTKDTGSREPLSLLTRFSQPQKYLPTSLLPCFLRFAVMTVSRHSLPRGFLRPFWVTMDAAALLVQHSLLAFSSVSSIYATAASVCFGDYITHFGVIEACNETALSERLLKL